jgi:hypothetical protein
MTPGSYGDNAANKRKSGDIRFIKPAERRSVQDGALTAIYKPAGQNRQGEKRITSSLLLILYYTI